MYWGSFPGLKQPRHYIDHSPPYSAEVKNEYSCTSSTPICLHGMNRTTPPSPLIVLYVCETWSVTHTNVHSLRVLRNRVKRRIWTHEKQSEKYLTGSSYFILCTNHYMSELQCSV